MPRAWPVLKAVAASAFLAACAMVPRPAATSPAPDAWVRTRDGTRLHYRFLGAGTDTVLVVHGGPGLDMNYLAGNPGGLAAGTVLVLYDQRATGRSEGAPDERITMETFIEDLEDVRKGLGLPRVNLLGHSWGALLALRYAAAHPERTRSLVLVSPMEPGQRFRAATRERQARARTPADSVAIARMSSSPAFQARDPVAVDSLYWLSFRTTFRDRALARRLKVGTTPRTAANGTAVASLLFSRLGAYDFWHTLARVGAPALIVHGDTDPIPVAMVQELARHLPNASLAIVPAGHFPHVERPREVRRVLERFWRGLPRD
ncbi:MAG TPA: alpha/beta hydrolase [Longimicrobium sp.]